MVTKFFLAGIYCCFEPHRNRYRFDDRRHTGTEIRTEKSFDVHCYFVPVISDRLCHNIGLDIIYNISFYRRPRRRCILSCWTDVYLGNCARKIKRPAGRFISN